MKIYKFTANKNAWNKRHDFECTEQRLSALAHSEDNNGYISDVLNADFDFSDCEELREQALKLKKEGKIAAYVILHGDSPTIIEDTEANYEQWCIDVLRGDHCANYHCEIVGE